MGINSPDYRAMARQKAAKYGIDPAIFERQIGQESGFNPNAKSPAGATGIAQIMPAYHPGVNATDPEASLDYAARLMARYLQQYGNDYRLALAAYNAGAGSVAQYGGVPPFQETQTYVASILGDKGAQEGKMAGPVDDINAQLKKLQDQIDKAERDAESADIDVSYPAQKQLVALNREYRQLLATAVSASKTPADTSYRYDLNTSARYIPKQGANAQYDVGSSDYAGNAPPGWERNVNFDEEGAAQDKAYQAARIADLQRSSEGSPTAWATLAQAQKQFDQKMAWDRTLAEMKAKQDQEQADRTLQGQLYNHINNIWAQNLPRMGDPSQVYFAGAGPGGPLETLFKQGGSSYDPNQGKIAWQNFDPNAAWKQAAGMVRR